ncbi:hypothetical protein DFO70_12322 [Cytobacillus firmus]|uniref:Uncharacterized protein n=2 Tax=Cytobacillus TaxID=2675230 RepID=A0A366JID3_CYTFI|nr:hypothetical protein DFO70_12322 [Cytobacillus firmus]TDX36527.1 hypothetical protein DFO72_11822 [Cytobacillus oceanisediminis]
MTDLKVSFNQFDSGILGCHSAAFSYCDSGIFKRGEQERKPAFRLKQIHKLKLGFVYYKSAKHLPERKMFYFKWGNPCWRRASYTKIAAVLERLSERTLLFMGILKK